MDNKQFIIYLLILSGSTYLIRALPFALVKKKIKNRFLQSVLYYIPYAVLTAMTIPDIFTATGSIYSAIAGFFTATVLALFGRGLTTVAILSCIVVYLTELLIRII